MDTYSEKGILKNKLNIKDKAVLDKYERTLSRGRMLQLRTKKFKTFNFSTLKSIHKQLFRDVYSWAGQVRTVNISKGQMLFCPCNNIDSFAEEIFSRLQKDNYLKGLDQEKFCCKAASLFGDINALHPFREGNGRAQREFIYHLSRAAGYELDLNLADKKVFMEASIDSSSVSNDKMELLMRGLIKPLEKAKKRNLKLAHKPLLSPDNERH